jgi:two-component sensor histidine kinase
LEGEERWFSAKVSMRLDGQGEFDGVTVISREITEQKRTQRALERRNRVLEILNRIAEEAWSTLEMGTVLDTAVSVVVQAINATSGYICDWDEERGTTTCLAEHYGPDASEAERVSDMGVTYHMGQDLGDSGDWLYSDKAYHVMKLDDPHMHPKEQAFMTKFGAKSMLSVPLRVRGKPFGYIELWESRRRRDFSSEEIDLVLAVAGQVAMGIENAQLYEQAQQEVAERKRTEERIKASLQEKEVLLKEVHHRVKNNLQVISSLLDIQALSIHSPEAIEALEDSRHRVRTMAFVHERLYQSEDLSSIGAAEYVTNLVGHLFAAYEGRASADLCLQIETVFLDLDTAIACGLLINELVSNALKHAFPTGWEGAGKVRVALQSLEDGRLELQVSDNGVGLPGGLDPEQSESLGLRLVQMLTQQLRGTLEVDRHAGTAVRITFADPGWSTPEEET